MKKLRHSLYIILISLLFNACNSDNPNPDNSADKIITQETVTLNPSGFAPLTATIDLTLNTAARISIRVVGKNGAASDVIKEFTEIKQDFQIPVLGLYANFNNTVELSFFGSSGNLIGKKTYKIQTGTLLSDLPAIQINTANFSKMADGFILVSYFGHNGSQFPQRPFIFDPYGDIRWYLNYGSSPILHQLFYDDGVERLANGNLYFGDGSTNKIYEIDMLGQIMNSWEMPGYGFHHEVLEKPNGNFLVSVNKLGAATVEDHVIEIDRTTKNIIRTWDFNQSLDNTRRTLIGDAVDWMHINALSYDAANDALIVSGRTQGVVKVNADNEVIWILGPHKGWATAGNGQDLNQYLLQPLDANDQAITDASVLDGSINHTDFEWNWYQHSPKILPNGNILLFDNGDNRNFTGVSLYSRAVEYHIDDLHKTVKQIWSYGKEKGVETYSRIVSEVDFIPAKNQVRFSPGAISEFGTAAHGRVLEIDYTQKEIVFDAKITPPMSLFIITFHRTERLSLYP